MSMRSHRVRRDCSWSFLEDFTALGTGALFGSECTGTPERSKFPASERNLLKIVAGVVPPVFDSGSCQHRFPLAWA